MSEEEKAKELLYWIIDKYSANFQTTEADMVKRMIEYKNADSLESKLERAREKFGTIEIVTTKAGGSYVRWGTDRGGIDVVTASTLHEALDKALEKDKP